jgi:hypothetical protein
MVRAMVRGRLDRATDARHIDTWASGNIAEADRDAFRTADEDEPLNCTSNFTQYGLRLAESARLPGRQRGGPDPRHDLR